MSKSVNEDFKEIMDFLSSPSPLGRFKREDESEYKLLKLEVENTGRILEKAQYVANMRKVEHFLAVAKLKAFVDGVDLDKDTVADIESSVANFIIELKEGVWY